MGLWAAIETQLPCGGGDVLIDFGEHCTPVTTELAENLVVNANADPRGLVIGPDFQSVEPAECSALVRSVTTGLSLVGAGDPEAPLFGGYSCAKGRALLAEQPVDAVLRLV